MDKLFLYAVSIALPLAVFSGLYALFLRNEVYFRLNRVYILAGLLLVFSYPVWNSLLSNFRPEIVAGYKLPALTVAGDSLPEESADYISLFRILSIIYITGTVFFSMRFLFRVTQILLLAYRHKKQSVNGFIPVYVKGNRQPFTFFNLLFLPCETDTAELDPIVLEHEEAHRIQWHSLDKLLIELACIVQWFNPAIWISRVYLDAIHEFLADSYVLKKGYNKFDYQKLMVETSTGMQVIGISSYFNATLLKKRIVMMSNNKSNKSLFIKYILGLTLAFTFLLFYTVTDKAKAQNPPLDEVFTVVEKMPEYPGGIMELRRFIAQNIVYPDFAKKAGYEAKVYVQFVVDENGRITNVEAVRTDPAGTNNANEVVVVGKEEKPVVVVKAKNAQLALEEEAVRVISMAEDFTPGEQRGHKVKVQYTFPINFELN